MKEFGRRMVESWLSILLFIVLTAGFVFLFNLYLRGYITDRVYPTNTDEEAWKAALDLFFKLCIISVAGFQLLWYILAGVKEPNPLTMRKVWKVLFVLLVLSSVIIPGVFIFLYPISSGMLSFVIFIYLFLFNLLPFLISTLFNYPEIKYASGIWGLFGK